MTSIENLCMCCDIQDKLWYQIISIEFRSDCNIYSLLYSHKIYHWHLLYKQAWKSSKHASSLFLILLGLITFKYNPF